MQSGTRSHSLLPLLLYYEHSLISTLSFIDKIQDYVIHVEDGFVYYAVRGFVLLWAGDWYYPNALVWEATETNLVCKQFGRPGNMFLHVYTLVIQNFVKASMNN